MPQGFRLAKRMTPKKTKTAQRQVLRRQQLCRIFQGPYQPSIVSWGEASTAVFGMSNACDRRRWRMQGARVGAAVKKAKDKR